MLSLLIPTYNYDVRPLVTDLLLQARQLNVPFEIIIEDDASDAAFQRMNQELSYQQDVVYIQNDINHGRSLVRNHLAEVAHYPYLLFMDCDAGMCQQSYLSIYLQFIDNHSDCAKFVVLGGVSYRENLPEKQFRLRWHYGMCREVTSASARMLHPYRAFTPFNLLITKSVFDVCRFDPSFVSYGFEDTLFGIHLKVSGIPIFHVNNVLFHDGLDNNVTYLKKVETALDNLARLVRNEQLPDDFIQNSKLLSFYYKCRHCHLLWLVKVGFSLNRSFLKMLILHFYSLMALDVYKLGYFNDLLSKDKMPKNGC